MKPTSDNPFAGVTDGASVSNIKLVTTSGYGGMRTAFDKDHYKSAIRVDSKLVEFRALQGTLPGYPVCWYVNMIQYNDDYSTYQISWPVESHQIRDFMLERMDYFIQHYQPKIIHFVASNRTIMVEDYDRNF